MFRLLPWSSVVGGNKVTAEEVKMLAAPQRRSPIMETATIHKLKRKRTNSSESDAMLRDPVIPITTSQAAVPVQSSEINNNNRIVRSQPESLPATVNNGVGASTPAHSLPQTPAPRQENSQKPENTENTIPPNQPKQITPAQPTASRKMDTESLRQTLDSQLSLEILLKHDELRLIDQEMAKCQVALEQLRRCAEIPFPTSSVSGISTSVSNGTGFAVLPPPGNGRAPVSPAPWGVAEGPYSRHYAKWLIPDPRFDGGEVESAYPMSGVAGKGPMEGRTTRGSWSEGGALATSLRSQRSSAGTKLQSLSSGYPPPKDKAGPMIIKRKSDGQLVKLVCLDCRRDNFSSTQGFINHCRIAHNRNFASHDAAAAASGEPVEVDEAGMIIGENNDSSSGAPAGYVHPLIRSAHLVQSGQNTQPRRSSSQGQQRKRSSCSGISPTASREPSVQQQPPPQPATTPVISRPKPVDRASSSSDNASFKASPQTPHLSSLLQRRGLELDLLDIVDDALTKTEVDMYSSDDDASDGPEDAIPRPDHDVSQLSVRGARLPARTILSPSQAQRPGSRKGMDKASRKPHSPDTTRPTPSQNSYRSPYASAPAPSDPPEASSPPDQTTDVDMLDVNLSPNTVESNQAPSLVSDDEDYEAPSESESLSPSSSESGDDSREFDNIEVQDGDDATSSTTSTTDAKPAHEIPGPSKHHPSPVPTPPPTKFKKKGVVAKGKRGAVVATTTTTTTANNVTTAAAGSTPKQQRRVSFVNPVAAPPIKPKKDGGKRQRRG
ncbi:hypothetical protein AJ80_06733 [Polytolypa hystricis UAMH7299]|uniref:AHC1-like C2H2 zinc-finger domain-containing protein n=1 Tax=Polytolypa hystricis (strain UAMH7299) TaxID=1447883 RepID=A0A2B7XU78_POLH7|nr:hypothetical protein AJ80_06733 [Polytolypa hystricis UAMH7299]